MSVAAALVVSALVAPGASANHYGNDSFALAPEVPPFLTPGTYGIVTDSTVGATAEPGEPAHAGQAAQHSVWFKWTAPAGVGPTEIRVCGQGNPPTDIRTAVYTGSIVAALSLVAQNDNDPRSCGFSASVSSYLTFTPVSGTVYRIAIDDNGASGDFGVGIAPEGSGEACPDCSPGSEFEGPSTKITKVKVKKRTAKIFFEATGTDTGTPLDEMTFRCGLDGHAGKPCDSPLVAKKLKPGEHDLVVFAIDPGLGVEGPDDQATFKIKKKK
ncbi:MAG TPA: hypothetical protein VEK39_02035 [Solirubrobacterales bacterium]|nr:hypothetical protein [Solirubrobacterales bacterium]